MNGITKVTGRAGPLGVAAIAIVGLVGPGARTAAAQFSDGPSILTLLPVAGSVSVGQEITGRLAVDDYISDSRRVKAYEIRGTAGDPVTIDLISEDFDAYLYLIGPDGMEVESDDDSGGQCHARISTFLGATGTYRVVAASFSGAEGAFTLRVADRQPLPASGGCGGTGVDDDLLAQVAGLEPMGTLSLAGELEGSGTITAEDTRVGDGTPVQAWLVSGAPGDRVVVDLMSRAFDTLLFVIEPGDDGYLTDDDSGGACNSRMELTLGEEPHRVIVSPLTSDGRGGYTLRVSATAGPMATGNCPGLGPDLIR